MRRQQVSCEDGMNTSSAMLTSAADDVRDIYRRAAREELVVEGLRDGQNLVAEE